MARSKSKGRGSSRSKKSASSAGPIDLSDPNMNSAVTLALVMVAGYYDSGFSNLPFQNNGTSWSDEVQNSLQFVNGKGTGSAIHETYWPFSLLLTLHVLNSVQSNGKWWANDLVNCAFNCFGGIMMSDLLNGKFSMPSLFASQDHLSLMVFCWFFVNHNIPIMNLNIYTTVTDKLNEFIPLDRLMGICTTTYNLTLLCKTAETAAAASSAGEKAWFFTVLPMACVLFKCVAVHSCSSFFTAEGINFSVGRSCSKTTAQAATVAFWYASDGLGKLPFIGAHLGGENGFVTKGEDFLGGTAAAIATVVLLDALFGHLIGFDVVDFVADKLYEVLKVKRD